MLKCALVNWCRSDCEPCSVQREIAQVLYRKYRTALFGSLLIKEH